ncbi:SDR family NAD(P)-dependent oxidoreductase [Cyanobium sp. CH-040]|nr:SDR family NAD(P)-dependent oxidoreductase [Cyanobium sp. CH-040]
MSEPTLGDPAVHLPPGVIVVTGASRGLGRDLVDLLLAEGREVIAVVRRPGLVEAMGNGADLSEVVADLSTPRGIEAAISAMREALDAKPLAALVNGAGAVTPLGPLADHGCEAMLDAFTLMAVAPARLATGLAPLMVNGGRVLNLSTRSAHESFPGLSLYCMSKHALHAISKSLRLELPVTLAVGELIPGEVDTGMQADLRAPDPEGFPLATFFRQNQANLIPCALAARFITWVLTGTGRDDFSRTEPWFIYDTSSHRHWLPAGVEFGYSAP